MKYNFKLNCGPYIIELVKEVYVYSRVLEIISVNEHISKLIY